MTIAARTCCFFMPLRFGAAVLGTLQFVLSAMLAIALWVEVSVWSYDVGIRITGTAAAAATYYTILSFSALIGSLAIYTRAKAVLRYFAFCLGWSLGLQLAVSALQLWGFLSTPRGTVIAECVNIPGMNEDKCMRAFALSIGWLITSIIVGLLVQLCSAYVVSSYSTKLAREDDFTDLAPAPGFPKISDPRPANAAVLANMVSQTTLVGPTFVTLADSQGAGKEKEKEWDASSQDSHDDDSDDDEPRIDPGPPKVPMLDPAPPKRIPRVRPAYPAGMGPSSMISKPPNAAKKVGDNPFSDRNSVHFLNKSDPEKVSGPNPFTNTAHMA